MLEGAADGEVECAAGFAGIAGEAVAVFEADGADGEFEPEAEADGHFEVGCAEFVVVSGEGTGIEETDELEGAGDVAHELEVGGPVGFAAEWVAVDAFGAEFAFGEASDAAGSAVEVAEVDGEVLTIAGGHHESELAAS